MTWPQHFSTAAILITSLLFSYSRPAIVSASVNELSFGQHGCDRGVASGSCFGWYFPLKIHHINIVLAEQCCRLNNPMRVCWMAAEQQKKCYNLMESSAKDAKFNQRLIIMTKRCIHLLSAEAQNMNCRTTRWSDDGFIEIRIFIWLWFIWYSNRKLQKHNAL